VIKGSSTPRESEEGLKRTFHAIKGPQASQLNQTIIPVRSQLLAPREHAPEKHAGTRRGKGGSPTRAEDSLVPGAGEVVALAEAAIDLAELRLVAQTLVAAALATAAAHALALGLPAGAQVLAARLAVLTLAAGAQVARVTVAGAAGEGAWFRRRSGLVNRTHTHTDTHTTVPEEDVADGASHRRSCRRYCGSALPPCSRSHSGSPRSPPGGP